MTATGAKPAMSTVRGMACRHVARHIDLLLMPAHLATSGADAGDPVMVGHPAPRAQAATPVVIRVPVQAATPTLAVLPVMRLVSNLPTSFAPAAYPQVLQ